MGNGETVQGPRVLSGQLRRCPHRTLAGRTRYQLVQQGQIAAIIVERFHLGSRCKEGGASAHQRGGTSGDLRQIRSSTTADIVHIRPLIQRDRGREAGVRLKLIWTR